MTKPKISVIVPTYNRPQTPVFFEGPYWPPPQAPKAPFELEVIVVDDGSAEPVAPFIPKGPVQVIRHEGNKGLSAARNTGLAAATGDYIQWLDDDDAILAGKLEAQLAYLEANPEVDIALSQAEIIRRGGVARVWEPPESPGLRELVRFNFITPNSPLSRRSALERVGPFRTESRTDYPLYGCEDWEYWLRAMRIGLRFGTVAVRGARNYQDGANMSADRLRMECSALWALSELERDLEDERLRDFVRARMRAVQQRYLYFLERKGTEEALADERRRTPVLLRAIPTPARMAASRVLGWWARACHRVGESVN